MGVRPALPVEGVDIILGNDLAGGQVWGKVSSALVVTDSPSRLDRLDSASSRHFSYPACAVTRAISKGECTEAAVKDEPVLLTLPASPLDVPRSELMSAQRADPSLEWQLESVFSPPELTSVAGYFLQDGVLVRKWVPHGEDFGGGSSVPGSNSIKVSWSGVEPSS